jgi:hypothetical protein
MKENPAEIFSQCHFDLNKNGHFIKKIDLPAQLLSLVQSKNYQEIDNFFQSLTSKGQLLFDFLAKFCPVEEIEFIISLRSSENDWEEDGIWHDDGSRILAFSLSLSLNCPQGGVLELREKGSNESIKIPTPSYGHIIVFKTGIDNFEHKINKVESGERLIIAGWCYPK